MDWGPGDEPGKGERGFFDKMMATVQQGIKSPRISRIFTDLIDGFFFDKKNPWKSVKSVATCSYAEQLQMMDYFS